MTDIEKALVCYDGDNSKPYCDLVYEALKEMQKRENPKQLTIEELRKMDGKPVWVKLVRNDLRERSSAHANDIGGWYIIACHENLSIDKEPYALRMDVENFFGVKDYFLQCAMDYGDTWLAYDYPPKEENK